MAAAESTLQTVRPGHRLGPYEARRVLGQGGYAVVFEARHQDTGNTVAVKTLRAGGRDERDVRAFQRFAQEVEAIRRVQHPNVVQLHDAGTVDGDDGARVAWFAMEMLDGETFSALVQRAGPVAPVRALAMVAQAARGLQAAHDAGIVHRDVKPQNLMWTQAGRAVVMDFGICRLTENERLTATGHTVGTLRYLAPEHVMDATVDGRADVFALAAVLYFLLTGRHLRTDDKLATLLASVADDRDARRAATDPALPAPVRPVLARALAVDPAARHASAAQLADELDALTEAVAGPPAPDTRPRAGGDARAVAMPNTGEDPSTDSATQPHAFPGAGARTSAGRAAVLVGVGCTLLGMVAGYAVRSATVTPAASVEADDEPPARALSEPWVDAMRAGRVDVEAEGLPPRARHVLQGLLAAANGAPCEAVEQLRAGAPEGQGRPSSLEGVMARQEELCRAASPGGRVDEPARAEPRAEPRPARPRRDMERVAQPGTASPLAPSPTVATEEEPAVILDDARRALLVGEFSRAIAQAKRVASQPALSGEAHKVMAVANARLGRYCTAKGHYLVYLESAPPALRAPVRQMLQEEEFKACP